MGVDVDVAEGIVVGVNVDVGMGVGVGAGSPILQDEITRLMIMSPAITVKIFLFILSSKFGKSM